MLIGKGSNVSEVEDAVLQLRISDLSQQRF